MGKHESFFMIFGTLDALRGLLRKSKKRKALKHDSIIIKRCKDTNMEWKGVKKGKPQFEYCKTYGEEFPCEIRLPFKVSTLEQLRKLFKDQNWAGENTR